MALFLTVSVYASSWSGSYLVGSEHSDRVGLSWAASTVGIFTMRATLSPRAGGKLVHVELPPGSSSLTHTAVLRGAYAAVRFLEDAQAKGQLLCDQRVPELMSLLGHVSITISIGLEGVVPEGASIGLPTFLAVLSRLLHRETTMRAATGEVRAPHIALSVGMVNLCIDEAKERREAADEQWAPGRCVPHQVHMDGSLLPVEGIEQKAAFVKTHQLIELLAPACNHQTFVSDTSFVRSLDVAAVNALHLQSKQGKPPTSPFLRPTHIPSPDVS